MASVALQIAQAIEARLNEPSVELPGGTKTPPEGLRVERERIATVTPSDVADGPLVSIAISAQVKVDRKNHRAPLTTRTEEYLVYVYAGATDEKAADAVDPAYNWVVHALQSEPTLGGLAHWVSEEGYDQAYTSFPESAEVVAAREVKIHVAHHTRTDDPEVRSNP